MSNCELCDKIINEKEIFIDENNSKICSNCVLLLHKLSIENNLMKYDFGGLNYIKKRNRENFLLQILTLILILIIIYTLK